MWYICCSISTQTNTITVKKIIHKYKNFGSGKARIHRRKPIIGNNNVEIVTLGYCVTSWHFQRINKKDEKIHSSSIFYIIWKKPVFKNLYCKFVLTKHFGDHNFLKNIMRTDEVKFGKKFFWPTWFTLLEWQQSTSDCTKTFSGKVELEWPLRIKEWYCCLFTY